MKWYKIAFAFQHLVTLVRMTGAVAHRTTHVLWVKVTAIVTQIAKGIWSVVQTTVAYNITNILTVASQVYLNNI